MPSKSPAQHRLMEAVAHSNAFAKKVGIKPAVGKEFIKADKKKGNTFKKPPKGMESIKAPNRGK